MKTISKTFLALLLLVPALAAAASTAVFLFDAFSRVNVTLPLLLGAAVHLVIHKPLSKNGCAYVMAHECSHALAALLSGAKIKKISVKKHSGYVLTDSTNTFITLAPYFVPFYAVAAGLLYFLAGFFVDIRPARPYFLALSGFFLSFHALSTIEILTGPLQSDIKKAGGRFFSYTALLLLNSLFAAAIIKLMFPELLSFKSYLAEVASCTKGIAAFLHKAAIYIINTARIYIRS
ncbi:MAG: hypothetical protein A2X34_03395 [Elusimicrobia bacterium GWC2_51_8]|nr:MAG: hypothetical protein A2X33_07240 [Elusimicrobia bacterium GWA2_51_34]OGR59442.1 MAG: hypothetical protein A2X34_03395 [Elusimicrobia bacterium GWC2_51_8]OGR84776.1 MAG: hypothetical protein A2021_08450 [Elusimicrobia bacterium GWF2_52_66]